MNTGEADQVIRSQVIETFLEDEVKRLSLLLPDKQVKLDNEKFENLFRKILGKVF